MKYLTTVLLLFTAIATHAQTKVYSGWIDSKREIEMHLSITNKDTCGYYFYKDKKIPVLIPLHTMRGEKTLKLIEGDDLEGGAYFEGYFEDIVFSGAWHSASTKAKPLHFLLNQINTETVNEENEKLTGEYLIEDSSQTKDVDITCVNNHYMIVQLFVGSENCAVYFIG